jgi:biotin operon repressor
MERGFFKIYRKIEDSKSWSRGVLYRGLMISLLEKANWKRGFFHGQEILPGQLAFSGECLADELDIPRTSVVRMLRNLELDGFLTRSNMNNRYTLITITNWQSYQGVENDCGQPMVNQRSTDGRPVDTIKEGKKERINTERVFNACARVERSTEKPEPEAVPSRQPSVAFDEFFEAFPEQHRGSRNEAAGEWMALESNRALPGLPRILDALGQWEDSEAWKRQGGRYIPTAANFLKREYWLRKPPEPTEQDGNGNQARPRAATVAQQRVQDNDDMAKMLLQARRAQHAQPGLYASTAGQSGAALPAGR